MAAAILPLTIFSRACCVSCVVLPARAGQSTAIHARRLMRGVGGGVGGGDSL